ncbi:hypothetical protein MNV49_000104 [Pseudohyphozyma bogoriensis]|nr:hypothetical protein MNV49_000104 [Pseudohyphozyma bogoriensis]
MVTPSSSVNTSPTQPSITSPHRRTLSTLLDPNKKMQAWVFPRASSSNSSEQQPAPLLSSGPSAHAPTPQHKPRASLAYPLSRNGRSLSVHDFKRRIKDTKSTDWLYFVLFGASIVLFFRALFGTGYSIEMHVVDGLVAHGTPKSQQQGRPRSWGTPPRTEAVANDDGGVRVAIPAAFLPNGGKGHGHEDVGDEPPPDLHNVQGDNSHDDGREWVRASPEDSKIHESEPDAHKPQLPLFLNQRLPKPHVAHAHDQAAADDLALELKLDDEHELEHEAVVTELPNVKDEDEVFNLHGEPVEQPTGADEAEETPSADLAAAAAAEEQEEEELKEVQEALALEREAESVPDRMEDVQGPVDAADDDDVNPASEDDSAEEQSSEPNDEDRFEEVPAREQELERQEEVIGRRRGRQALDEMRRARENMVKARVGAREDEKKRWEENVKRGRAIR